MVRRFLWLLFIALLPAAVLVYLSRPETLSPDQLPDHSLSAERGELLVHAGGCYSCHGSGLEGGLEMESPFGSFRVPNITPDPRTGIGAWSTLEFVNAMRGVAPDGQHYYPAFPYPSYRRMRLTDLMDLKAYLDTVTAVSNDVPDQDLRFPWNLRRGLGFWKRLYLADGPVVAIDPQSTAAARGRYLVEGAGHCGACHTPRNRLGGLKLSRWVAGGPHPDGKGSVPNITPHPDGLAGWSQGEIVYYLETGFTPDFDTVGGSMVKVQEHLSRLPRENLEAIAAYLKAVPPVASASAE